MDMENAITRKEIYAMYNVYTTEEIREMINAGKANRLPDDVIKDYQENMEARQNYSPKGVRELYKAVCYEAVINYKTALKYIEDHKESKDEEVCKKVDRAKREKNQIVKFFESDFFKNNSQCRNTKRVIENIEANM